MALTLRVVTNINLPTALVLPEAERTDDDVANIKMFYDQLREVESVPTPSAEIMKKTWQERTPEENYHHLFYTLWSRLQKK